ncbi:MAG: hypothetical protein HOC77_09440 [Chloroflexi bacterium]|jgi:hypothetical protein|nr:hypothetical protein [Chloroflexota bacterium]MBT4074591.1 hypothetical protein [Chloroflexota bacterium]MBT4515296.1 hypothetical protein [Chloroflexota bacterium]MBT5318578.1 hypothetical protein [Chloroflexota bacterium]MBT6681708.1 hypothetical protein [Chloroflexota bacterium]
MASQSIMTRGPISASGEPDAVDMTPMQSMARKMWIPFTVMGVMIVVVAFLIGLFSLTPTVSDYFDSSKDIRDTAAAGSDIAGDKASIEATKAWLPGFKFLGLGLMLGGITFLLATIIGNLRVAGGNIQRALGASPQVLKKPMTGHLFPIFMMMGMMILIATFIISIWLATQANDYWDHSITTELNTATAGSGLLDDLSTIQATKAWLTPLKFVGMALMFTGIALALATIVQVLRFQARRLVEIAGGSK